MPIYAGNQKLDELYIGAQKIAEGWRWDGSQWVQLYSSVTFAPAGMTKSTNQLIAGTALTVIPGWTPDAGSAVVSDGLLAGGTNPSALITATVDWSVSSSSLRTMTFQIRLGETVLDEATAQGSNSNNSGTVVLSATHAVSAEDTVVLYASRTGALCFVNAGSRITIT